MSDRFPFVSLSPEVEAALALCGRESVMFNDGVPASIAIRQEPIPMSGQKWLVKQDESHSQAGRAAAEAYADRLKEIGNHLINRAHGIHAALKKGAEHGK